MPNFYYVTENQLSKLTIFLKQKLPIRSKIEAIKSYVALDTQVLH